jgi:hypothetical protein
MLKHQAKQCGAQLEKGPLENFKLPNPASPEADQ